MVTLWLQKLSPDLTLFKILDQEFCERISLLDPRPLQHYIYEVPLVMYT